MTGKLLPAMFAAMSLAACAGSRDHFYTLSILPGSERAPPAPAIHVLLNVTLPAALDRAEMVVSTAGSGIRIVEHERWPVPLAELASQTLARDLEQRRGDILVGGRDFDQAALQTVNVKVEIVRMAAMLGGQANLEAHWRIMDAGTGLDTIGSAAFDAPAGESYQSLAAGYSQTLSALAGRLSGDIRPR